MSREKSCVEIPCLLLGELEGERKEGRKEGKEGKKSVSTLSPPPQEGRNVGLAF